ncbi:YoaK family protein [Bradyrhizobium sp. NP1]|uniref:YoaK family protein n=1 Tax=Bradyrhizobium sp. NP1 TaxID=3049772 RepID=UPI0025A53BF1|nr:YoaK family protein [Bradyrhizobium sp. NP1]WJR79673.1 YoaK family protein [Bradyrhizobium sp. NP1]
MLDTHRNITLACALSALAGYVDSIGYLHLGGLFVSFMSGNSTRLGVSLAAAHWWDASAALGLIVLFVVGAGFGSLIVRGRSRYCQCWLLLVEALLLAGAGLGHALGAHDDLAVAAIVLAMGLENAVFQIEGGSGLGLTYVTGALVKVGQLAASAITGGPRFAWLPNLMLWAALVAGGVGGALAYRAINLAAIWFAAAVALLLAVFAAVTAKR